MSERDLSELLSRVERAEGPDREIDALIYIALEYPDWRLQVSCDLFPEQVQVGRIQEPEGTRSVNQGFGWRESPKFTASLDAAVGLVEKMLREGDNVFLLDIGVTPKIGVSLSGAKAGARITFYTEKFYPKREGLPVAEDHAAGAPTGALALVAALLKALIEGERTKVLSQEMGD